MAASQTEVRSLLPAEAAAATRTRPLLAWGPNASPKPLLRSPAFESPEFRLQSHVDGDIVHMTVSGELDMATDDALRSALATAMPRGVRLDLTAVPFMACSTLTVLLQAATKRAGSSGAVAISAASNVVRHLVGIADLEHLLVN